MTTPYDDDPDRDPQDLRGRGPAERPGDPAAWGQPPPGGWGRRPGGNGQQAWDGQRAWDGQETWHRQGPGRAGWGQQPPGREGWGPGAEPQPWGPTPGPPGRPVDSGAPPWSRQPGGQDRYPEREGQAWHHQGDDQGWHQQGWSPGPPPSPRRRSLPLVVAGVAVLVLAVVGVLGFWRPGYFVIRVFDHVALEQGVAQVLRVNYGHEVSDVSCATSVRVVVGSRFTCDATVDGVRQPVPVTVTSRQGDYEVGPA